MDRFYKVLVEKARGEGRGQLATVAVKDGEEGASFSWIALFLAHLRHEVSQVFDYGSPVLHVGASALDGARTHLQGESVGISSRGIGRSGGSGDLLNGGEFGR
jgi:hypothetical protein